MGTESWVLGNGRLRGPNLDPPDVDEPLAPAAVFAVLFTEEEWSGALGVLDRAVRVLRDLSPATGGLSYRLLAQDVERIAAILERAR